MSTPKHTRGEIPGPAGGHRHLPQPTVARLCLHLYCDPVIVPESMAAPVLDSHR